jgi:hypothetical protein
MKTKIDCKNNGKWKFQTCFSPNYDFAFTNLLKNAAEISLPLLFEHEAFPHVILTIVNNRCVSIRMLFPLYPQ